MNALTDSSQVLPFVSQALERDGAAVEAVGGAALFVVVPKVLQCALELPAAATTLEFSSSSVEGRHAFPLEGTSMQWLIDRARSRGRRAGARLASPLQNPTGRLQKAEQRLVLPNAKIASAGSTHPVVTRLLLEFGYEAQCEERTDGRVFAAMARGGLVASRRLADALIPELGTARPEAAACDESEIERAAACAAPVIERGVRRELEGFRAASFRRLEAEKERIVAYHERLVHEAGRRRGIAAEVLESKRQAIRRQRRERLDDLAERHAVDARFWLASVLVLRYEISLCRFRVRRRRREVDVSVQWDPFLKDFVGPACESCSTASLHLHVCDAAGHVTCRACAAACAECGRVTCKACERAGCACVGPGAP